MSDETIYDLDQKCTCSENEQKPLLINHSPIWHDGDIVCDKCKKLIRTFDAG